MNFPKQPRTQERRDESPDTRIRLLERDADTNERDHSQMQTDFAALIKTQAEAFGDKIAELTKNHADEMKELRGKVDRLSFFLATASVSFALLAISFVLTRN